eukprot:TRINITY_DN1012_c0_g4_i1.p1 TRINITY_DN1012_c0_g4~~TRINITY_DN1012_c0_g4_i1.p1  ORF type:complete len:857 (+),score=87.79 TRINITY_DN1012_c0_g4_i1:57-2573(+)
MDLRNESFEIPSDEDLDSDEEGLRRYERSPTCREKMNKLFDRLQEKFDVNLAHRRFSLQEREKQQQYQSLDYIETYSNVYKKHIRGRRRGHSMLRWILFMLVGLSCGFIAFMMRQTIDLIIDSRMRYVGYLIENGSYVGAWFFVVGTAATLAAAASAVVVYIWSNAAGSGVEEVIAYLNGIEMPRVFNIRTAVIKFISTIASVSSGLPVGPEGPMIHLGAICGAGLTQGRSKTLNCTTSLFKNFRNTRDHRDFITAGAGAGISAAFGAPIGGLLFVMEEMSTHWKPSLTWMIFFTSMVSFCTVSLFNSAFDAWHLTATFGVFANSAAVLFEVKHIIQLNILAVFPSILIGALGGIFGGVFTLANVTVNRWRLKVVNTKTRKMIEPVILAVLFATVTLLLPLLDNCQEIMQSSKDNGPTTKTWSTEQPDVLATFMCSGDSQYNPLASLTLSRNGNIGTIRRLFSRGTYPEFGSSTLVAYFLMYFCFAIYSAGMSISSGLLVPMILMGATMGRIVGNVLVASTIDNPDLTYLSKQEWIDPGVFALIGSAAFIGGVSRLTVSLVVIMLEISAELHFLLPIMIAVMVAKWVGSALSPSLYHALLDIKCVPMLDLERTTESIDFTKYCALDAVPREPVCIDVRVEIRTLCDLLKTTTYNCFPVVSNVDGVNIFKGTILRKDLETLLQITPLFEKNGCSPAPPLSYRSLTEYQKTFFHKTPRKPDWHSLIDAGDFQSYINLDPYINCSPFTVQPEFSLDLTYDLFTHLGLRHLVILKRDKCMGIITRKDLISGILEERLLGTSAVSRYHTSNRPEWTEQDEQLRVVEDDADSFATTSANNTNFG